MQIHGFWRTWGAKGTATWTIPLLRIHPFPTVRSAVTAKVLIQIRVLHEIPAGTLQRFTVRAQLPQKQRIPTLTRATRAPAPSCTPGPRASCSTKIPRRPGLPESVSKSLRSCRVFLTHGLPPGCGLLYTTPWWANRILFTRDARHNARGWS